MSHLHFSIPPQKNAAGETTERQWHAEYVADSVNEDYDHISFSRVAVVEFPEAPPLPTIEGNKNNQPFYFVTVEERFNPWLYLWVHFPATDFVVASAKRLIPTVKLTYEKLPPGLELPPNTHLQELFEELLKNPALLFPLNEQTPGEKSQQKISLPEPVGFDEERYPQEKDLRYYFFK